LALPGIPPWTDQDIKLYHGTLDVHVASVLAAVDVTVGGLLKDFGRGFYTTTSLAQATHWAMSLAAHGLGQAAVLRFTVSRNDVAQLETLAFVRGEPDATDYWSFIQYCRTIGHDHNRQQTHWYDMAIGPVTGTWKRQTVIPNADQISFHTPAAEVMLNNSVRVQVV
jgi:Protein of unknown function (DUF3990)